MFNASMEPFISYFFCIVHNHLVHSSCLAMIALVKVCVGPWVRLSLRLRHSLFVEMRCCIAVQTRCKWIIVTRRISYMQGVLYLTVVKEV